MNIGIRLHDTKNGTLEERLGFARAQGFSCAHLAMSKAVAGFKMEEAPARLADPELAAQVREAFRNTGMEMAVLGCYLNLADPEEESRKRTQEIYFAHLAFAAKTGAGVVGTETYAHPSFPLKGRAGDSEEAYQLFLDSLRTVVRKAEETGTLLAVEPVWTHIIDTPEKAERMLNDIRSDNLRIILDAVNLLGADNVNRAEEIIQDGIRRLGDRVSVLHMKDYQERNGKLEAVACGLGEMKYETLLRFGQERNLPMTLENTVPDNAEAARRYLEKAAEKLT